MVKTCRDGDSSSDCITGQLGYREISDYLKHKTKIYHGHVNGSHIWIQKGEPKILFCIAQTLIHVSREDTETKQVQSFVPC